MQQFIGVWKAQTRNTNDRNKLNKEYSVFSKDIAPGINGWRFHCYIRNGMNGSDFGSEVKQLNSYRNGWLERKHKVISFLGFQLNEFAL